MDDPHKTLLREKICELKAKLNPDIFIDHLVECLGEGKVEAIKEESIREEKVEKLLSCLNLKPVKHFDLFCKTIAGVHPSLFSLLKGDQIPTREETDFIVKDFSQNLKQCIIDTGNKTESIIDKPIDLDTQYVSLRLNTQSVDGQDKSGDSILPNIYQKHLEQSEGHDIEVHEILPKHEQRTFLTNKKKATLLKGRGGIGKSTVIQLLSRRWAKGQCGSEYTCVFILNLRKLVHIKQEISLTELVGFYAEYVVSSATIMPPSEWLENNSGRILLLIDGVDEVSDIGVLFKRTPIRKTIKMKVTPLDWCVHIMRKDILEPASLVVISRPFIGLHKVIPHDRVIDVLGLTDENIDVFVDKNVSPDKTELVKETLRKDPVLRSACSITFYCSAICRIVERGWEVQAGSLNTYTRITAYIITRLASRNAGEEASHGVFSDALGKCLPALSTLASKGLHTLKGGQKRLVFTQEDMNEANLLPEQLKAARYTGLFTYSDIKDPSNPDEPVIQGHFIHLSVQEFLGVANLIGEDINGLKDTIEKSSEAGKFNYTELFAYGLVFDSTNQNVKALQQAIFKVSVTESIERKTVLTSVIQRLCSATHDISLSSKLQYIQLAYESQEKELATMLAGVLVKEYLIISNVMMTAVDMKALVYTLRHSKIKELHFNSINLDVASLMELQNLLESVSTLYSLIMNKTSLDSKGMEYLAEAIKSAKSLEHLSLIQKSFEDVEIENLLCGIKNLQGLVLEGKISRSGMEKLAKTLKLCTNLTTLELITSEISDEAVHEFFESIDHLQKLVFHAMISAKGIEQMVSAINLSTNDKKIELTLIAVSDEGLEKLSIGIEYLTTLKLLGELSDNGMRNLAEIIKNSPRLTSITLTGNCISNTGIGYLAEVIKSTSSLTNISLTKPAIDPMGRRCLQSAMKVNPKVHIEINNIALNADVELLKQPHSEPSSKRWKCICQ